VRRSLCSSRRRRLDSSSQSILWASHVFTLAALKRIMRPFCRCTRRRASATCSSARRRSSSIPIRIKAVGKRGRLSSKYGIDLLISSTQLGRKLKWNRPDIGLRCLGKFGEPSGIERELARHAWLRSTGRPIAAALFWYRASAGAMRFRAGYVRETK